MQNRFNPAAIRVSLATKIAFFTAISIIAPSSRTFAVRVS